MMRLFLVMRIGQQKLRRLNQIYAVRLMQSNNIKQWNNVHFACALSTHSYGREGRALRLLERAARRPLWHSSAPHPIGMRE